MKPIPLVTFAAATLLAALSASAQVYRCKSPDGNTSYSSAPCPTNHQGGQVKLTDNTLETRTLRERDALARELEGEREAVRQWQQQQRTPLQPAQQTVASQNASYECRLAIKNANTQSNRATPQKIDAERATAIQICGFNPWPGSTLTEIDAANRRSAAMKVQAEAKMRQEEEQSRGPASIASCDSGGCWGTDGHRYNGTGGGFFRDDGKFCTRGGSMLMCN